MVRVHLSISKNNFLNIQEWLHNSEEYVQEKVYPEKSKHVETDSDNVCLQTFCFEFL